MARTELELLISVIDQASDELKGIANELEDTEDAAKKAGKGAGLFGMSLTDLKSGLDMAKGALRQVKQAVQEVYELGKLGAQAERAEIAFRNLSGGTLEAAENLRAMQDATGGALPEMGAMAAASKLMSMGLATNTQELGDLTEMAVTLGRAFGRDAASAIDEFGLLLANQSKLRLDTFGISSAAVTRKIEELKAAGMDANEAFMQATFEEGKKAMERLGDGADDAASSFETLEAQLADTKVEAGKLALRLLDVEKASSIVAANKMGLTFENAAAEMQDLGLLTKGGVKELRAYIYEGTRQMRSEDARRQIVERSAEVLEDLNFQLAQHEEATRKAQPVVDFYAGKVADATVEVGDLTEGLDAATARQILMNRAFGDGTMDAEELRAGVEEATGAFDDLAEAAEETKERIKTAFGAAIEQLGEYGEENLRAQHATTLLKLASGELTIEEYKVREASEEVIKQFMDGEITWDTAIKLIQSFGEEAGTAAGYLRDQMIGSLQETKGAAEEAYDPVYNLKVALGELTTVPEIRPRFDFSALEDPLSKLREMRRIMQELGGAQVKWGGYQVPEDTRLTWEDTPTQTQSHSPEYYGYTPPPSGGYQYEP